MAKKITIQEIKHLVDEAIAKAKRGELGKKQDRVSCGECLNVEVNNNTGVAKWCARVGGKFTPLGEYKKMPYESARKKTDELRATVKAKKEEANLTPTLKAYFDDVYMPEKAKTFKKSSHKAIEYKGLFNLAKSLHGLRLNEITRLKVITCARSLDKTNRTRRAMISVISHVLSNACNNGLIDNDPLSGIFSNKEAPFPPEATKGFAMCPPDDFVPKVMTPLKDTEVFYRVFFLFLALTAFRGGEARALKWQYVNFDDRVIVIPPEAEGANKHGRGDGTGKAAVKPMTQEVIYLLRYLQSMSEVGAVYVFQTRARKKIAPISDHAIRKLWDEAVNKDGKVCDMHGIRKVMKTWAEAQRVQGVDGVIMKRFTSEQTENALTHDVRSQLQKTYDLNTVDREALPVLEAWNKWLITRLPNEYLDLLILGRRA